MGVKIGEIAARWPELNSVDAERCFGFHGSRALGGGAGQPPTPSGPLTPSMEEPELEAAERCLRSHFWFPRSRG